MYDFMICGWRVRSDIVLADAPPWNGQDHPYDVTVRLADVPPLKGPLVAETPFLQIREDGLCRLDIPEAATYLIQEGREVIIAPKDDASPAEIQTFLVSVVLAILAHQRGLFPLHAAAVSVDGAAVLLAGPSHTGKSTLAAAFARRGHAVLADDVSVVEISATQAPVLHPSVPTVRLWRDSVEALDVSCVSLAHNRRGQEKYHVPFAAAGTPVLPRVPLRMIYLLGAPAGQDPEAVTPLPVGDGAAALETLVCQRRHVAAGGREADLLKAAVRIAATVPIRRLDWHMRFEALDELVQALEADMRA
jgi:hypothetical protein